MARMVHCAKLKKELPGLDEAPLPGELGKRIYENISAEAWDLWIQQQLMMANEYKLNLIEPDVQKKLDEFCEQFLFGDQDLTPPEHTPEG